MTRMAKTLFSALMLLTTASLLHAQTSLALRTEQLAGPVHLCIIEEQPASGSSATKTDSATSATRPVKILTYDPFGHLVEESAFSENGCIISQILTAYGEGGKIARVVTRSFGSPERLEEIAVYNYDSRGRLQKITTRRQNGQMAGYIASTYQIDGVRTDSSFDSKGTLKSKRIFYLDAMGNPLRETWYTGGQLNQTTVNSYNAQGLKVSEELLAGPDRRPVRKTTFDYDGKGLLLQQIISDGEKAPAWKIEYSYDPPGRLRTISYYKGSDHLSELDSVVCDEHNNWISLSKFSPSDGPAQDAKAPFEQLVRRIYYYCGR